MTPKELLEMAAKLDRGVVDYHGEQAAALRSYAELCASLTWMANRGIVAIDPRSEDDCVLVDPPRLTQLARELGWPGLEET